MNKKLITLAVAAAMVAPLAASAETTLYGRLDNAIVNSDDDVNDSAWDVATNTSRIGVKGSEDLGNGLKAIFNAEWAFNSSEGGSTDNGDEKGNLVNRVGYVGLTGGFGTVALGRQWTPYAGAVNATDTWNSIDTLGRNASVRGQKYVTRMGNMLSYVSPNFSGLTASIAMAMDRGDGLNTSDGVDAYNPTITYSNGPLKLGASYFDYNNDLNEQDFWGLSASYSFGMFRVMAQYEDIDETENTKNDDGFNEWALNGEADFGNNTVRVLYGQTSYDGKNPDNMDFYGFGLQHNFSKRTRIYAEYAVGDKDFKTEKDSKQSEFSLGLRHDF